MKTRFCKINISRLVIAGICVMDVALLLTLLSSTVRIVILNTVIVLVTNPWGMAIDP